MEINRCFASFSLLTVSFKNQTRITITPENFAALRSTESHTDFIFHHLITIAPLLTLITLFGFGLLLTRIATVCSEIKHPFSSAIAKLTFVLITTGTLWGILGGLGYIPMPQSGVNIPYLSYGGSLLVANIALIGFSLGAVRRKTLHLINLD